MEGHLRGPIHLPATAEAISFPVFESLNMNGPHTVAPRPISNIENPLESLICTEGLRPMITVAANKNVFIVLFPFLFLHSQCAG